MSGVDAPAPWRIAFDNARDPYTARNALGAEKIGGGGGGGGGFITSVVAPFTVTLGVLEINLDANHLVVSAFDQLALQPGVTLPGTARVGVPPAAADNTNAIATTAWVTAKGYLTSSTATATYQPLDADLTAIAALSGTNTIYYRSAANIWSPVVVSTGLAFSGGNLTATGGGGNVSNSGTPVAGQVAEWVTANTIAGVSTYAKLASPALTGTPTAPTAAAGTNSTQIATTAFVKSAAITQIVTQTFTANGTYTPTAGMKFCIIECQGGGGGGGTITGAALYHVGGSGGGSGGYSRHLATAADIGASKAVTIGPGGSANTAGGATSVGSLCTANGGTAGTASAVAGASAAPATGNIVAAAGNSGGDGAYMYTANTGVILATPSGKGASSIFGGGAIASFQPATSNFTYGWNATGYGSGGGGATANNYGAAIAGGNGSAGIVIITEYI